MGLAQAYAFGGRRYITRDVLENLSSEDFRFYANDSLVELRGEERYQEKFVLQGLPVGGNDATDWEDIKPMALLPGEDPNPLVEDEDDYYPPVVDSDNDPAATQAEEDRENRRLFPGDFDLDDDSRLQDESR